MRFISKAQFGSWVGALTQHELSEDPNDFIANQLLTVFDVFMIWLTYREYGKRRVMRSAVA